MQLEFAIFCEAAEVSDQGLIDMLRGGFDIIAVTGFPVVARRLILVVRIISEPKEINQPHTLVSQLIDPNGHVLPHKLETSFTTPPYPGDPNRRNKFTLKLDYWALEFVEGGNYTFRLLVDGVQIGEQTLEVKLKEKVV